ncbi:neprilysin-4-like [Bacillus rossius redtenbacheri]|uniref:neprilysin-4-like n=1 Tax=Bacillus rossius redtenbacheri TaxID=93214 RepID=UPI002FDE49CE
MCKFILQAVLAASVCSLIYSNDANTHRLKKGHVKGSMPWPLNTFALAAKHVCWTEECKETAETLIASMDRSVDPCEDFYTFTCGGWVKKHPVPPTAPHRNQFDLVTEQLDYQLKDILEEDDDDTELEPVKAAKQMYKACMDTDYVEQEGVKLVCGLLGQHGGWPMAQEHWDEAGFDWQRVVASMARRLGLFPLLLLYVHYDRTNTSQNVITVDQPSLVLPRSMLVDPVTYGTQLRAYRRWIVDAATEIVSARQQNVPKSRISIDAFDVVEFEVKLAKLTSFDEMRRNVYRMHNPMTLRDLQKWTDSADTQVKVEWKELLEDLFQDTNATITQNEKIEVRELDFMFNFMKLINETPKRVLANYLNWRLVKKLSRDNSQKMRDLAFRFEQVISGTLEDLPRWQDCVMVTSSSLNFAVGYMYVKRYFNNEAKMQALEMVENIRNAFAVEVSVVDWMDERTRRIAQEKAAFMEPLIGFPDWFNNSTAFQAYHSGVSIGKSHLQNIVNMEQFTMKKIFSKLHQTGDRNEWASGPSVVNAFYIPQTNSIMFPAAILQPPFFKHGRPQALNYGSIGVVIGHEITHGFDDMGRHTDKYGNLKDWWSDSTADTYQQKADCFVKQYSSYRVPELDSILHTNVTMNGVTTLGENMADLGGLRQAFRAYQQLVQDHGPELRLPKLEEFSPEQLFFIGFGMVWCEAYTKESLLQEVLSDPHSPHRMRVQGTLANSAEFSRVWNCPKNSAMNPQNKCLMW